MQHKMCCFGELLLRMSPGPLAGWQPYPVMPFYVGGAELNVATALAQWDMPVRYVTALPDNFFARQLAAYVQQKKIDTSQVLFSGNRVGLYYLPEGTDVKNGATIYDRQHSAFAELRTGIIDWEQVLAGCTWLHFSAITPALSDELAAVCTEALEVARAKNITISLDLNYREKLWQHGRSPEAVVAPLAQYCQVIMGNIWAAEKLLGIPAVLATSANKTQGQLMDAATESMDLLLQRYPNATTCAYTFRMEDSYWAVLRDEQETVVSNTYATGKVVDKVGSGDCFMAGLIYGVTQGLPAQHTVDFAAAAAIGKLQERGDATAQSVAQIEHRILQLHG